MLTGKERSYLRRLAHDLRPGLQVGKDGIDENVIKQFDEALETRELIKATVLKNSALDGRQACELIAGATGAQIVQVIGKRFVLYRESKDNRKIFL